MERVLTGAIGTTALLGILGAVQVGLGGATSAPKSFLLHQFDLDAELNVPSLWSASLLAAASLAAVLRIASRSHLRAAWALLAALFAFMGADELVQFHERLQRAVAADWQLAYLPVILAAGAAWAAVVWWGRNPGVRLGLVLGAALWAGGQVLELLWQTGAWRSTWASVPEEVFEMLGDVCFLAAALASLRPVRRRGVGLGWAGPPERAVGGELALEARARASHGDRPRRSAA
jgi:hypothetical protein